MEPDEHTPNANQGPSGEFSGLDEELRQALERAQHGQPGPLLDNSPLTGDDALTDDALLVPPASAAPARGAASENLSALDDARDKLSEIEAMVGAPPEPPAQPMPSEEPSSSEADEEEVLPDVSFPQGPGPAVPIPSEESASGDSTLAPAEDTVEKEESLSSQEEEVTSPPVHTPAADAAAPGEEEEDVSQAELDMLFAQTAPPLEEAVSEEVPASQEVAQPQTQDEDTALSQGELDQLIARQTSTAAEAPASSVEDEDDLSQAGLDALIAQQAAAPQESPEPAVENEGEFSQAELDALFTQTAPSQEEAVSEEVPASQEEAQPQTQDEDAALSQAELDALIAQQASAPQEAPVPPADDEGDLSQAELDALIAQQASAPQEAPAPSSDDEGDLSQAELDALIAQQASAPPEAPAPPAEDEGDLSQAELDALIAQQASAPPEAPAPPAEDEGDLSQAELDALIAQQSSAPPEAPAPAVDDEGDLSQAELDALIAQQSSAPPEAPAPSSDDERDLSQAELDALIAQQSSAPQEAPAPAADDEGDLSQAELDALIAQQASAPPEAPAPPADDERDLSQAELDALIAQQASAPPEVPAPPADDEGDLSQAELDALIAQQTSPPAEEDSSGGAGFSQEELDPLFAESTPPSPSGGEENILSQDELDRLIAQEAGSAGESSPQPAEDTGALSQGDLDALLAGSLDTSDSGTPSEAEAGASPPGEISQDDIDALIAASASNDPLDKREEDELLTHGGAADIDAITLDQSSIDSIIHGAGQDPAEPSNDAGVSQDMIDSIIAGAGSSEHVGAENVAAAASSAPPPSSGGLLRQEDLDAVLEQAKQQDRERALAKQRAIEKALSQKVATPDSGTPAPFPKEKAVRKPSALSQYVAANLPRVAASLIAALLTALMTFTALYTHREQAVTVGMLGAGADPLQDAMTRARNFIARRSYGAAIGVLDDAIEDAPPGNLRDDARYLRLEAVYRNLDPRKSAPSHADFQGEAGKLVKETPNNPRAPEALHWTARLYQYDAWPHAARDVYEHIIKQYPAASNIDEVYADAAELALELRQPLYAAEYTQSLLSQYPGSPFAGRAKLLLADAYRMAGMESDARTLYVRITQSEPDSALGAEAFMRLARMAYDQNSYRMALQQLQTRLATSTTTKGNDEVYLLMAQVYRQMGRLDDAEGTLSDLIHFLPDSKVTPLAFVELSKVFQEQGNPERALDLARSAATRYPKHPDVLRNKGELLGLNGNPFAAATALLAAEEAGANDPAMLLQAARYFRIAGDNPAAKETYRLIRQEYPSTDYALTAGIQHAALLYEDGQIQAALEDLDILAAATLGKPQHLSALQGQADIYRHLGLSEELGKVSQEIARLADDPETLAQAALALLDTGHLEESREIFDGLDLGKVGHPTAHHLLASLGEHLAQADPRAGLELMEQAYFSYPEVRTPESELRLLRAYLAAGSSAAARRLVMELDAESAADPRRIEDALLAATDWGDYLYGKGDYRTASDAYGMAMADAARAKEPLVAQKRLIAWAEFQHANALMRLDDLDNAARAYDGLAQSDSPWAADARVLAESARLQQRLQSASLASR